MAIRPGTRICYFLVIMTLSTVIWPMTAYAQSMESRSSKIGTQDPDRDDQNRRHRLDEFLASHPELAAQLLRNPSLVNDEKFVADHPDLGRYLQKQPEMREDLERKSDDMIREEQRDKRREDSDSDPPHPPGPRQRNKR
jgi:hypothetical protein